MSDGRKDQVENGNVGTAKAKEANVPVDLNVVERLKDQDKDGQKLKPTRKLERVYVILATLLGSVLVAVLIFFTVTNGIASGTNTAAVLMTGKATNGNAWYREQSLMSEQMMHAGSENTTSISESKSLAGRIPTMKAIPSDAWNREQSLMSGQMMHTGSDNTTSSSEPQGLAGMILTMEAIPLTNGIARGTTPSAVKATSTVTNADAWNGEQSLMSGKMMRTGSENTTSSSEPQSLAGRIPTTEAIPSPIIASTTTALRLSSTTTPPKLPPTTTLAMFYIISLSLFMPTFQTWVFSIKFLQKEEISA